MPKVFMLEILRSLDLLRPTIGDFIIGFAICVWWSFFIDKYFGLVGSFSLHIGYILSFMSFDILRFNIIIIWIGGLGETVVTFGFVFST